MRDIDPKTGEEISRELKRAIEEGMRFWSSFGAEEFFEPVGGQGWSPAQNVAHLARAMPPVTLALNSPRWILRALFGRGQAPSRSYSTIRDKYQAKLNRGAGAGPFTPRKIRGGDAPEQKRQKLLARLASAGESLEAALAHWDDEALDHYRMLHPLIGWLTVREMVLFSIYHLTHHQEAVARRRTTTVTT